jgi:type VI secretion system protein ImpL
VAVTVHLKLVSGAQANADGSQKQGLQGATLPATVAGGESADIPARATTEGAP